MRYTLIAGVAFVAGAVVGARLMKRYTDMLQEEMYSDLLDDMDWTAADEAEFHIWEMTSPSAARMREAVARPIESNHPRWVTYFRKAVDIIGG